MGRIVKKAEERRSEILQKTQELFFKIGYRNTSVNMVIEALGISKGAFYHYFKSKEQLLDCLSEQFTENIMSKIEEAINIPGMNALEKLNSLYLVSTNYKAENIDFIITITEAMYSNENLLMRHKFHNKTLKILLPIMSAIFQQGKDDGIFTIDDAQTTARIVLLFGFSIAEYNAELLLNLKENPETINEMQEHFTIYQNSIERILGAPAGSFRAFDKNFFEVLKITYLS